MKIDKLLSSEDDFAAGAFLSGAVTGLLVGLTVGILLAPKSGKKMRKSLKGILANQTKDIQDKLDQATKHAKGTIDSIKSSIA